MYKRKFSKAKTVVGNASSQLRETNTISSVASSPTVSSISSKNDMDEDVESGGSPSMLDDLSSLPVNKKKKTEDTNSDSTTDCSQPMFDDVCDDTYSYLKQSLSSCGLHLKSDQNILCKPFPGIFFVEHFLLILLCF